METDNFTLEVCESSEDGEKPEEKSALVPPKLHPDNEEQSNELNENSVFPVLLIDSVCSLSDKHDYAIGVCENIKRKELMGEQLISFQSIQNETNTGSSNMEYPSLHYEDQFVPCEAVNYIKSFQDLPTLKPLEKLSFNTNQPALATLRSSVASDTLSVNGYASSVFREKLSLKYSNYRKRNNEASRQWRQKNKEKQAEALEKNKRLRIQHQNLQSLVEKLNSNASAGSRQPDLENQTGDKDPLADDGPANKKMRLQQKHVHLEEENERLARENDHLCQVIEELMKGSKAVKKPLP